MWGSGVQVTHAAPVWLIDISFRTNRAGFWAHNFDKMLQSCCAALGLSRALDLSLQRLGNARLMTDKSIFKRASKKLFGRTSRENPVEIIREDYDLDALLTLILGVSPEQEVSVYYQNQKDSDRPLESLMNELLESGRVQSRLSDIRQKKDAGKTDLHRLSQLLELMLGHGVTDEDVQYRVRKMNESRSPLGAFDDIFKSERFEERINSMKNLFVNPGHFYSPVVDVKSLPFEDLKTMATPSVNDIEIDKAAMIEMWNALVPFMKTLPFPKDKTDDFRYYFNNPAFNFGDAAVYFGLLQKLKPKKVIEVGSGYSSALLLDTVDRFFEHYPDITFIDPYPELVRTLVDEDQDNVSIIAKNVQDVDLDVFEQLGAGDILFIDSTHILKTHSDVLWELTEILPRLAPGVIIHFHDIFWPFEYRELWIKNPPRSWNEVYALQLFLMNQTDYEIMFFNDYFAMQCTEQANKDVPGYATSDSAGLWLRKTESRS